METEPEYETPTITEIVDIIDLLRPWMHGFNLATIPANAYNEQRHMVVCDCGWAEVAVTSTIVDLVNSYQRHVGYEPE